MSNQKKEEKKTPKMGLDSRELSWEHEKTRTRKFNSKWQVGRPWLKHDVLKGWFVTSVSNTNKL